MSKTALTLLSSGLDSLVATAMSLEKGYDVKLILFFNYGQRAYKKEIEYSKKLAKYWDIEFKEIDLTWFPDLCGHCGLMNDSNDDIPELESVDNANSDTAKSVWVPNRNGVFINIAAAVAEANDIKYIITGFNKEESQTFPDNSLEFINIAKEFFKYSTMNGVEVISPTINFSKKEIVANGYRINAPFEYLFSCYKSNDKMCGKCESCQRLKKAFKENNIYDIIKENFI